MSFFIVIWITQTLLDGFKSETPWNYGADLWCSVIAQTTKYKCKKCIVLYCLASAEAWSPWSTIPVLMCS